MGGSGAPTSDMWVLQMLFRTFGVASSRRRLEAWCSRVDRGTGQTGLVLGGGTFEALTLPRGVWHVRPLGPSLIWGHGRTWDTEAWRSTPKTDS